MVAYTKSQHRKEERRKRAAKMIEKSGQAY